MTSRLIDFSFTGDKVLIKKLNRLKFDVQKKELRKAMQKAAKPVKARAEQLAPWDTGELAGSIKIKSRTRKGFTRVYVQTGYRWELGIPEDNEYYYPAANEFGATLKNGGVISEDSYMRAALYQTQPQVKSIMIMSLRASINKLVKK